MIKLSKRDDAALKEKAKTDLEYIREALKKEPIVIRMFKKNKRDINEIDNVSIQFDKDLEVSAKTINGDIFLNAKMLEEDWKDYYHYLIHELSHYCDHKNNVCNENSKNVDYLDNPEEIKAFENQLQYREKTEGPDVVNEYIKELFDKHDIPKDERPEKKKELLSKGFIVSKRRIKR